VNRPKETRFGFASMMALAMMLFANGLSSVRCQKLAKPINIQAQTMGTSTQLGRNFGVTVIINEFSPPADQKILLEAFQQKGNEGLVKILDGT
jgi:hypothetical protein